MDATVADQYIAYPTDPGILNECREKCEVMIDKLYKMYQGNSNSCPHRKYGFNPTCS